MTYSEDNPRIAVDLMPILPGGLNGGAKALTLDLLNELAVRGWGVFCLCNLNAFEELRDYLIPPIDLHIVAPWQTIGERYNWMLSERGPFSVNFFPFQGVSLVHPTAATVSIVHDVQFADMPNNFSSEDRAGREAAFHSCVRLSDRLITVSNFTKERVQVWSDVPSERIDVIYNAPSIQRKDINSEVDADLEELRLTRNEFILYPANFWEHKNHRTLIAAFSLFKSRTGSKLKLVMTGDTGSPLGQEILALARGIAPGDIVVPGYLQYQTVETLIQAARAVVFPSEYEGFGIPVVEAMLSGVPVAAAWSTCLPEVTGGAALLFDPTRPQMLADAIMRITSDEKLRRTLILRGRTQVRRLGTHADMVTAYEEVLRRVAALPRRSGHHVSGITSDGWVGQTASITTVDRACDHSIEAVLAVPDYFPINLLPITVTYSDAKRKQFILLRGASYRLTLRVPRVGGTLNLTPSVTFKPSEEFGSSDTRALSFRVEEVWSIEGEKRIDLLQDNIAESVEGDEEIVVTMLATQGRGRPKFLATAISARPNRAAFEATRDGDEARDRSVAISAERDVTDLTALLPSGGGEATIQIRKADSIVRHLAFTSLPIGKPTVIRAQRAMPGFSVVMPSYNQGRFIKRTIDSVLQQALIYDFHVFDGGSQDETVDVLRGYGDSLKFQSERDSGQSQAVNRGIAAGSGSIIAWLNSDDTYQPNAFAQVADVFARCPDVGVVYGDGYHIDEDDQIIERYPTEDFRLSRLFETCILCQPATFFRREVVERHGGLRETLRYCMDYELWLRFGVSGVRFQRINAFLANTRFYADTKTLGARPLVHREINDMFQDCFGTMPAKWLQTFAHIVAEGIANGRPDRHAQAYRKIKSLSEVFWRGESAMDSIHSVFSGNWP